MVTSTREVIIAQAKRGRPNRRIRRLGRPLLACAMTTSLVLGSMLQKIFRLRKKN
jgi:hypothetical protein